MNKLQAILAKLEGKTLAEQISILKAEIGALFASADAAKEVSKADLDTLSAKLTALGAAQEGAVSAAEAKATKAEGEAASANAEAAKLAARVVAEPAHAHAAAAGHVATTVPPPAPEGASVVGSLGDKFLTICGQRRVNGNPVANTVSADAVRFFLKNQDALRMAAHDRNDAVLKAFETPGLRAAFTSGGTPTTGTGLALTVTAIQTIRQYGAFLAPFLAFSRDFSPEAMLGTTLLSRVVPLSDVAVDLNTGAPAGDYLAAAATTTTLPVTIDMTGHPITGFSVTPDQVSNMAAGVWPQVMEANQALKVYALARYCLKATYNVITAANYGASVLPILPANLNATTVANLSGALKVLGFQPGMMSLVLNSSNWSALGSDSAIANNFAVANQVATTAGFEKPIYGFRMVESPTLPEAGTTPANEFLTGFACMPGGLCVAMRPGPQTPMAVPGLVYAQNIEDPETGAVATLSMQMDPNTRSLVVLLDNRFGAAKGDAAQLKRITSQ